MGKIASHYHKKCTLSLLRENCNYLAVVYFWNVLKNDKNSYKIFKQTNVMSEFMSNFVLPKKPKAEFHILYKWLVYGNLDQMEDLQYYHHLFHPSFF